MKSLQISVVIWAATLVPSPAPAVNIETVLVGNPGNAADTQMMSDGTTGYGLCLMNTALASTKSPTPSTPSFSTPKTRRELAL